MPEIRRSTPGISRRSALKWAGLGLGSVIVAGGVGAGIRGATNGVFNVGVGDPYDLWRAWPDLTGIDRVVGAGALSCNPHNTQPWRFEVNPRRISLYSDSSRRMPYFDPYLREHFAGLGAAIESMVIAARGIGMSVDVTTFPRGSASELVAILDLSTGSGVTPADTGLAEAIARRHTNRGPFTADPLGDDDMSILRSTAAAVPGTSVAWVTESAAVSGFGALLIDATERIIADHDQSCESFEWFRPERADIERERDGVTLDCQGLEPATLLAGKLLPPPSRSDGDGFWLAATRDVHTATAAAYGVVRVGDPLDHRSQLDGGRALTRLHLAATERGLAFHHMNQITERIDRDRSTSSEDVFTARWSEMAGIQSSDALVSFRIGTAQRAAGLSPRRAMTDVVT